MKIELRPVAQQVMVITGASSGVGLETAKEAAARGASVVLAGRDNEELAEAVQEIRCDGGRAVHLSADVADPHQVDSIAEAALRAFGRIDTWVNNAAVSVYGRITELPIEDMRRQMDINYWGQVHGSRTAVRYLRERGGAIINVRSAFSDRAMPLQGNDCAARHALKAFTDTLRRELDAERAPIAVALVEPASAMILHTAQYSLRGPMLHPAAAAGIAAAAVALAGAAWRLYGSGRREAAPVELEFGLS